jgi:Gpi18-like mannosyltransferase
MLAAAALLLRLLIMPHGGFPTDIGTFKAWAAALADRGPGGFYGSGFADYLPGYLYVLWLIGEVHRALGLSEQAFLVALKLPASLADLVIGWLIFLTVRRSSPRWALALSASYLFNPGIVFNSAFWGQVDAVGAALALAGFAAMGWARPAPAPVLASALIAAAVLVKPQTGPAAIPAGLYLLRTLGWPEHGRPRWDLLLWAGAAAAALVILAILPFGLGPVGLVRLMGGSMGVYPYSSVVAFNLWGAAKGFWVSDGLRWFGVPHNVWGLIASLAALAAVAVWKWRHPEVEATWAAAAVVLLAAFTLPTRIHERYLLPAFPFFAVACALDRRIIGIYAGLSVVFASNLLYAYTRPYLKTFLLPGWIEATVLSGPAARAWGAVTVALLAAALYLIFTWARRRPAPA